jgi:heme-degrading monooxygenase HmoA
MPNIQHILEIVIFTVKSAATTNIVNIRKELHAYVKGYKGFIEMKQYYPAGDSQTFADIVTWDTLENALNAAKAFEAGDEKLQPIMQALEDVKFIGHFKP